MTHKLFTSLEQIQNSVHQSYLKLLMTVRAITLPVTVNSPAETPYATHKNSNTPTRNLRSGKQPDDVSNQRTGVFFNAAFFVIK